MAIPITDSFVRTDSADRAVSAAMTALDIAHDRAVSQRRNFVLTFVNPNRIRLGRQGINAAGVVTGTTQVEEFLLEGGQSFLKYSPASRTRRMLRCHGRADVLRHGPRHVHQRRIARGYNGDVVNGTIFFGVPNQPLTARAVTIFGVTGFDPRSEMERQPMDGMNRVQQRRGRDTGRGVLARRNHHRHGVLAWPLSLVGVFTMSVQQMRASTPMMVAREKAREAVESVHAARDTGEFAWNTILNVAKGGVFLNGRSHSDGPASTAWSTPPTTVIETIIKPGDDGILGTCRRSDHDAQ